MDWQSIIITALGSIGVLDFGRIIFFKANKKKANAEADGLAVEALKNAIAELRDENAEFRLENKTLREENILLKNRLTALFDDMCIHKGCAVRKPHQGQGERWYDDHADDPSMGCDYDSIYTLIKRYKKAQTINQQPQPEDGE